MTRPQVTTCSPTWLAQAVDRAIGLPGDVGEKFQRMAAGRVAQEFFFAAQPLQAVGFGQRDGGQTVEVARRQEPELVIYDLRLAICDLAFGLRAPHFGSVAQGLEFPELRGAALAEVVEGADADQRFHLLGERLDAQEEIGQRGEWAAVALAQDGFAGAWVSPLTAGRGTRILFRRVTVNCGPGSFTDGGRRGMPRRWHSST